MSEYGAHFDLLTERWIPCLNEVGDVEEVGVLDAFRRAHELRGIADASPLVTCSLYRFLEAVLNQSLDLPDEDAWAEHWEEKFVAAELIARIEEACTGRFDLFDESHPFYQSADIPLSEKPRNCKTVGYLAPEAATGTNVAHFGHDGDGDHAFCPVCCAKGLVVLPAFASSGGAGIKPTIGGVPPIYVMPLGQTIAESLMLNYVLPGYRSDLLSAADPGPIWAGEGIIAHKLEVTTPVGYVQGLTWPARRVRLFPTTGGRCSRCGRSAETLVREMVFDQGWSRPREAATWRDPWAAYRQGEKNGQLTITPVRPRPERGLWRDFPALFLVDPDKETTRPAVLNQLDYLVEDGCLPPEALIRFDAFALRTDMKAKIFEWVHDSFDFPAALIESERVAASIKEGLHAADQVARDLVGALRLMHPIMDRESRDAKAVKAALEQTIRGCLHSYWASLERAFREELHSPWLTGTDWALAKWLDAWRKAVRSHARAAFEAALDGFDASADDLRRQQRARARFYGGLKKHLGGQL